MAMPAGPISSLWPWGQNYLGPGGGDVIVRYKSHPSLYITVGTITPPAQGSLTITGRTPTTASLAWSAPPGSAAPAGYDIYRQRVGTMSGFSPGEVISVADNTVSKAGSTTGLTFTDQGLGYDVIYAYYVVANYAAGNVTRSQHRPNRRGIIQGLPPTPVHLQVDLQTQSTLTLNWSPQGAQIKESIIYRKLTQPTPPAASGGAGTYVIGGISDAMPIGQSSSNDFDVSGLAFEDQCEYSVQAVDESSSHPLISAPVTVTIPDLTPPTAPGNLQAGDVLRQGN